MAAANLTLLVRVENAAGGTLAESYHAFRHEFPGDLTRAAPSNSLQIGGWMELPAGRYRLAVSVGNPDAALGGDAEVPIALPPAAD